MGIIDKRGKIISLWEKARNGRGIYIFLKCVLIFCSSLFGRGLILRRFIYNCGLKKRAQLKAKVISIGNITLGGTGKTPLVEYVARNFKKNNKGVSVLSRGYGGGDEALLFSKRNKDIPILTGKNRIKNGREAIDKFGALVIILDDGFQHWPVERDLDIVALDSTMPVWNERLFPAGDLREEINSLKRADVFVLTKVDMGAGSWTWLEHLKKINPQAPVFLTKHTPLEFINRKGEKFPLSIIRDKEIVAFSGIARPQGFEGTLERLGGRLLHAFRYPDHHFYTARELMEIKALAREICFIATTEKDLVRIDSESLDEKLLALAMKIEFIKDEDKFLSFLEQIYG